MKTVIKKIIGFLTVFLITLAISPSLGQAEYVDECLEQPELCEEESAPEESEVNESELLEEDSGSSLFFELIKLFFALILVVGLIYASLYFLKRNNRIGNRLTNLESVGGVSLGQNKSIQLIRLKDRMYVIGVGEDITLLEEIKDQALIDEILKEKDAERQDLDAGRLLDALLPKKKKKEKKEFDHLFQQELNRLERNRKSMIDRRKED